MGRIFLLAGALALCAPRTASADQAEWVPRPIAEREAALLRQRTEVVLFCAPCADDAPQRRRYAEVRVVHADGESFEVQLDEEAIDAAYTYVEVSGVLRNLALLVGFPVSDVPDPLDRARVPGASQTTQTSPAAPASSMQLDAFCTLTYGRDLTRTCRLPNRPVMSTRGDCDVVATGQLDAQPGDEQALECVLADRSGVLIVLSGGALRYAHTRWELAQHRVVLRDFVANGAGVLDLAVYTSDEDGSSLTLVATQGAEWRTVLNVGLGGGMAEPDFSRDFTLPEVPAPALTARVMDRGRLRTERYRWDARVFRFVRGAMNRR